MNFAPLIALVGTLFLLYPLSLFAAICDGILSPGYSVVPPSELKSRFAKYRYVVPNPKVSLGSDEGYLVGFERNSNGHIIPLRTKDPRRLKFSSIRQLDAPGDWESRREVILRPLDIRYSGHYFRGVGPAGQALTNHVNLGALLHGGTFPITTEVAGEPDAFTAHSILMYKNGDDRGRSGVLIVNGYPIVLRDGNSGKEWVLELKGAGGPRGGIVRNDHLGYKGGATLSEARRETSQLVKLASLQEAPENFPIAAGYIEASRNGLLAPQMQISPENVPAIILRLAPGTHRATFGPSPLNKFAERMGQVYGDLASHGHVVFTHPENWIFNSGEGRFYLTDFSDSFGIHELPVHEGSKPRLLQDYRETLRSRYEVQGYKAQWETLDPLFFAAFGKAIGAPLGTVTDESTAMAAIFKKNMRFLEGHLSQSMLGLENLLVAERRQIPSLEQEIDRFYGRAFFPGPTHFPDDYPLGLGLVYEKLVRRSTHEVDIRWLKHIKAVFTNADLTLDERLRELDRSGHEYLKANGNRSLHLDVFQPFVWQFHSELQVRVRSLEEFVSQHPSPPGWLLESLEKHKELQNLSLDRPYQMFLMLKER